jgi:hypothetical protein
MLYSTEFKLTYKRNLLVFILFVSCLSGNLSAREQTLGSLKAAYIYNIAKFTRWPESVWLTKESPFKLCLYGNDDTTSQLKLLADRNMHSHNITVIPVTTEITINDCQLLYISPNESRRYRYLFSLLKKQTTLTIGNDANFLRLGGVVNLIELKQRLHFEVNMEQLAYSKLTLSSKLLKLGKLIDKPR